MSMKVFRKKPVMDIWDVIDDVVRCINGHFVAVALIHVILFYIKDILETNVVYVSGVQFD